LYCTRAFGAGGAVESAADVVLPVLPVVDDTLVGGAMVSAVTGFVGADVVSVTRAAETRVVS
jgi:hypothetical protein